MLIYPLVLLHKLRQSASSGALRAHSPVVMRHVSRCLCVQDSAETLVLMGDTQHRTVRAGRAAVEKSQSSTAASKLISIIIAETGVIGRFTADSFLCLFPFL